LHPRICSLLETCLADNRQAWDLGSDGTYVQRKPGADPVFSAHERLLVNSWGLPPQSSVDAPPTARDAPLTARERLARQDVDA